jgi:hypothetical protein
MKIKYIIIGAIEGWELLSNPIVGYVLASVIGLGFTYIGGRIYGFLTKKEYIEAVKYCTDELEKDDDFIKNAAQIIGGRDKIDKVTAEEIIYLPVVKILTEKYVKTFGITPAGSETLSESWLQMELRDMLVKAWNSGDEKNSIIRKIKKIKNNSC